MFHWQFLNRKKFITCSWWNLQMFWPHCWFEVSMMKTDDRDLPFHEGNPWTYWSRFSVPYRRSLFLRALYHFPYRTDSILKSICRLHCNASTFKQITWNSGNLGALHKIFGKSDNFWNFRNSENSKENNPCFEIWGTIFPCNFGSHLVLHLYSLLKQRCIEQFTFINRVSIALTLLQAVYCLHVVLVQKKILLHHQKPQFP